MENITENNTENNAPATPPPLPLNTLEPQLARQVEQLAQTIKDAPTLDADTVAMLVKALEHDEDVKNADAAGYIRGRNDKIDVVLARPVPLDEAPETTALIPRYNRRSIWD